MKRLLVLAFSLFAPLACFAQSFFTQSYPVGAGPTQLVVADFNGDHILNSSFEKAPNLGPHFGYRTAAETHE